MVVGAGVAAAVACWELRTHDVAQASRASEALAANRADLVRLTGDVSVIGEQHRITLDAQRARQAMRDGVLHVALPDGTTYPVRMQRQETDGFGQWSVIGRVDTAAGPQSAVLTFGGNAVFGTLPMPNGESLSIVTNDDVVLASLAGGLAPLGRTPGTDIATLSREDIVAARMGGTRAGTNSIAAWSRSPTAGALASAPATRTPTAQASSAQASTAQALNAAPAPPVPTQVITPSGKSRALSGPITITVVAVYADDLVALRGSESAVQTELSNQIVAASQAHIDSGSIVRFQLVGTQKLDIPGWVPNDEVLYAMTAGPVTGVDTEKLRDNLAADIVAIVRPHTPDRIDCGISWVGGMGLHGTDTSALFGYAVVNTEPCGPHVMAHELGHQLGAAHDRETDYAAREVKQGAFPFAFGQRADGAYATIMSYADGAPWLGVFSNPSLIACNGVACGTNDRNDTVRGFNLMAKTVSEFRTAGGKATISDTGAWEDGELRFPVRLSANPPETGVEFKVEIDRGAGWEQQTQLQFIPDVREAQVRVVVEGDGVRGPDRVVRARITSATGYPIARSIATGTVYNADPRPVVKVRVFAPDGTQYLASPRVLGVDGPRGEPPTWASQPSYPLYPSMDYDYTVAPGSNVEIFADKDVSRGLVGRPLILNEVRRSKTVDIQMVRGVPVHGDANPASVYMRETFEDRVLYEYPYRLNWTATDKYLVYPGATVQLYDERSPYPSWYGVLQDIRKEATIAVPSRIDNPAIVVHSLDSVHEGRNGRRLRIPVIIEIVDASPLMDPVKVVWRTLDGTAKRDVDYIARIGSVTLTGEQPYKVVFVDLVGDAHAEGEENFFVAIDPVAGYVNTVPKWRINVRDDDLRPGGPSPRSTATP